MIPYIIKSFRGGESDESDKGVAGSFKHGHSLDIHDRDDTLKCSSSVTTIDSTTTNDLIQFFVTARDGSTYGFGDAGSIYAISGDPEDPEVTFVYNDENGKIRGAAEWQESDGTNFIYWATNTSVARAAMDGSIDTPWAAGVATQDHKTTLDAAEWHTMNIASGRLMIANGNFLASIDFTGAFDPAALNIRPGNLIKTIEERDDLVTLGSERRDRAEEGYLWNWRITAQNWVQKKRLPIKGLNALITAETPLVQGGTDGEIFPADFVNSVPLAKVPTGGQVRPGGVTIDNDLALFGIYGGDFPGLWSYGRRHKDRGNALSFTYRLQATVDGSTVSTIGAVANQNGQILASWGTTDGSTTDFGIDGTSSTTRANALYEGLEFDGNAPYLRKHFDRVKVTFSPLASGTSFSIKYKKNKQTTFQFAVFGDGTTTFSTTNETEVVASLTDAVQAHIFEIGMDLNASGSDTPEIQSITTYVEEKGSTHG